MSPYDRIGNYEPLLRLASGGMGVVYVARRVGAAGFERLVVLKQLHRHLLANADHFATLRDEARLASRLHHPNVVSVIDVVESGGELTLVLDYVESISLMALQEAALARGESLSPAVVARVMIDTLAGMHAAHEATDIDGRRLQIIHRDVSPQNILVGVDGTSRLIDFGIAKAAAHDADTTGGVLKGKLRYMSPEQVNQGPLDRRTDIFSAGVVLYEALTGERLFRAEDDGDLILSILLCDVPPPSSKVPGLSPALDAVLSTALQRDRDARFATAAEFQEALERAIAPAAPRSVARMLDELAGPELAERRARVSALSRVNASAAKPSRGSRMVWAALVVALLAVFFVGATSRSCGEHDPVTTEHDVVRENEDVAVPLGVAPSATAPPFTAIASATASTSQARARPRRTPTPAPTITLHRNPYARP